MTNAFVSAVTTQSAKAAKQANKTTTTNGARAFKSTLNACVDLFGQAGSSRGRDVTGKFKLAFQENPEVALRTALYLRDVRGGAGERQAFRDILMFIATQSPKTLLDTTVLEKTAEVGRWDDLLILVTPKVDSRVRDKVVALYKDAITAGNGLAAKWAPRKGEVASRLRSAFGWTPKFYRKTIVGLTQVVETQMCNKNWAEINFNHVPSKAMTIYSRAFMRNALDSFNLYKESLTKGTGKVNATAVFPHDVTNALNRDYSGANDVVFDTQWKSLPDYINSDANILPMIDTSSSMGCSVGGIIGLTCMDVSISLGLYISERIKGDFKDMYLTFNERPELKKVSGTGLRQRYHNVKGCNWGGSTNIEAAFQLVLNTAVKNKVPESDMPKYLIILSDMQFNPRAIGTNDSGFKMAKKAYKEAGYELPKIIFWNLNAYDNVPIKFDTEGTALVSGFSPSIMKAVLSSKFDDAEAMTPLGVMMEAVMVDRYDVGITSE